MSTTYEKHTVRLKITSLIAVSVIAIGILQYLLFNVAVKTADFRFKSFYHALSVVEIIIFFCMVGVVILADYYINETFTEIEEEMERLESLNTAAEYIAHRLK